MNKDLQIFDLIAEERSRQMKGIELIASENFVSSHHLVANKVLRSDKLNTLHLTRALLGDQVKNL